MTDLVTRLTEAVAAAIANEHPAPKHPVGRVRDVTIELVIDGAGQVRESVAYIERRTAGAGLMCRASNTPPVEKGA